VKIYICDIYDITETMVNRSFNENEFCMLMLWKEKKGTYLSLKGKDVMLCVKSINEETYL
jgi:hypothetical protein